MNKRRRNILTVTGSIVIVLFLFGIIRHHADVFCYDSNIAHPNITDLASKVYFENTGNKLTDEQINCLRTGAIDEDMPIRWLNHFYDPVNNRGLSYDSAIDPTVNLGTWQESKKWIKSRI